MIPGVECIWSTGGGAGNRASAGVVEQVLPTGLIHIAIRLSGEPLKLISTTEPIRRMSLAVVGGPRECSYTKLPALGGCVGAVLQPGAARALFGCPAGQLSGQHLDLSVLWGAAAEETVERLAAATPGLVVERLWSEILTARSAGFSLHPAVAEALSGFARGWTVAEAVRRSGYSHRRFTTLFRDDVGLAPKAWCRIRRLQRAVDRLSQGIGSLAEVAADTGYSDQAHFTREFQSIAGVSPGEYRRLRPASPNHILRPVPFSSRPAPQGSA